MNHINKIFYIVLILFFIVACNKKNNKMLEVKDTIDTLSDSTFITKVGGIESSGRYVYIAATKNNCVYCVDDDFKIIHTMGRTGHGPGEFVNVGSLSLCDSLLFAKSVDQLNIYTLNGEFIKSIKLKKAGYWTRKICVDEDMYIYYSDPVSTGHIIAKADTSGNIIDSFGELIIKKLKYPETRNVGHIFKFNKSLIFVSKTEPIIRKYEITGELLDELDLSSDKYIKKKMEESEKFYKQYQNQPIKVSSILFPAADIYEDNLYIINLSSQEEKTVNFLYVINLNKFKLLKFVKLNPESIYHTIEIYKDNIICFDLITQSFHIYDLESVE